MLGILKMKIPDILRQMNSFGAVQISSEFSWLIKKILLLEKRELAVEIGVFKGGTFFALTQLFDRVIGIDIKPGILPFDLRPQDIYITSDSKDKALLSSFDDNSIDFLFIDGDHSYEGVSQDFKLWLSKVRKDGMIAFHDIKGADIEGYKYGVKDFWASIKHEYKSDQIIDHTKYYGIGVIWK